MKKEKETIQNSALAFLKGREMVFNALESGIFSIPSKKSERESDNLFPPEFYEITSTSKSLEFYQSTYCHKGSLKEK